MKAKKFTTEQMNALIIDSLNNAYGDLCFGKDKDELKQGIQFTKVRRTAEHKEFTYRIGMSVTKDKEGIIKSTSISVSKNA